MHVQGRGHHKLGGLHRHKESFWAGCLRKERERETVEKRPPSPVQSLLLCSSATLRPFTIFLQPSPCGLIKTGTSPALHNEIVYGNRCSAGSFTHFFKRDILLVLFAFLFQEIAVFQGGGYRPL